MMVGTDVTWAIVVESHMTMTGKQRELFGMITRKETSTIDFQEVSFASIAGFRKRDYLSNRVTYNQDLVRGRVEQRH